MKKNVKDRDIVGIVARSPWFDDLPADALKQLAMAARLRIYRKNSFLYATGESGGDIYCIVSGKLRLLLTSALGQEYAVNDLEPEFWLGEQFLIDKQPTSLDALVIESSEILVIPRACVLDVADKYPLVYRRLFEHTLQRTRGVFLLLQGQAFYPLRSRLAGWLVTLIEKQGQQSDTGIYLDANLSQNDLAQLSLGSRQRVNKILGEWRERGIVELEGNRYLIHDMDALLAETELTDADD